MGADTVVQSTREAIDRVWNDEFADIAKDLRVWARRLPDGWRPVPAKRSSCWKPAPIMVAWPTGNGRLIWSMERSGIGPNENVYAEMGTFVHGDRTQGDDNAVILVRFQTDDGEVLAD